MSIHNQILIRDVQRAVAERFEIPLRKMWERDAHRGIARPRQVSMVLAVELTGKSNILVGRYHGGRDHSTIWHARKRIAALVQTDAELAAKMDEIRERFRPQA
jgi:chromosomal replication initiator protein